MVNTTSITDLIGKTPLFRYPLANSYGWELYLKLEKFNAGQSMKDRVALNIIEQAEQDGRLKKGSTIIESSSGNTATGLAMIAASKGYKFIAIVDNHASSEKIGVLKAYGAEVIFVKSKNEGHAAMQERRDLGQKLSNDIPNSFYADQANNPDNPLSYTAMAQEILDEIPNVDILIGAISTGGSLCGTGRSLKKTLPNLKVIAIEPHGSTIFGKEGRPFFQSGTGNPPGTVVPENVDYNIIDEHGFVSDAEAFNTARFLARNFGVLIGGSSGGVVYKALDYINRHNQEKGIVVTIIPDGGEKYLSSVFNDDWMADKDLLDKKVDDKLRSFSKK